MILRRISLASRLHGFVDVLWCFDAPVTQQAVGKEKVLPTGTFEFVLNLSGDRIHVYESAAPSRPVELSGAIVCGVHSQHFLLDAGRGGRVAGVHFRPGGAYPWLRDAAAKLANRHVDLASVLGPSADALRRELSLLPTAEAVFDRLEAFLVASIDGRRRVSTPVMAVVAALDADPFSDPIKTRLAEFGITRKALIDAFKRQVGLTPKKLMRVLRFQQVLAEIAASPRVDWVDVALRCGYFDQAHFGRDFKQFSGLRPREYVARAKRNPNHVRVA